MSNREVASSDLIRHVKEHGREGHLDATRGAEGRGLFNGNVSRLVQVMIMIQTGCICFVIIKDLKFFSMWCLDATTINSSRFIQLIHAQEITSRKNKGRRTKITKVTTLITVVDVAIPGRFQITIL